MFGSMYFKVNPKPPKFLASLYILVNSRSYTFDCFFRIIDSMIRISSTYEKYFQLVFGAILKS